jgi:hypothetical protein
MEGPEFMRFLELLEAADPAHKATKLILEGFFSKLPPLRAPLPRACVLAI